MPDEVGPEPPTEELIQQLQRDQNPDASFRILFERYHGQVVRFFRRKGISAEDAEELTQDVFISVFKSVRGLHDPGQYEAWLFRIALNAFRNHLERLGAKKREGVHVDLAESTEVGLGTSNLAAASANTDPVQEMIDAQQRETIRAAIDTLPDQMRRCLMLRVSQELSNQEIAKVMGISINTVKAHLQKARKALLEILPAAGER